MNIFLKCTIAIFLAGSSQTVFSQQLMRDNLGSHIATKDLNLNSFNINAANLVSAKGIVIGTATVLSNTSIALQVEGVDKAILVPRVTDLLNATSPSIPVANIVDGMIAYDVATTKFYHRENGKWVHYADADGYVNKYTQQLVLGQKTFKSDSGFVAPGTFVGAATTVATPIAGAGTRMMWYPAKAAFRAGTAKGTEWDLASTGIYSTALGYAVTASGDYSTALGSSVSTGGFAGAFIIGDQSSATVQSSTLANQITMRFAGGYKFYTGATTYVSIDPGANGMSITSDKRKKENFEVAQGEAFIQKIDTLQLSSWNYKGQDAKKFRHYGPMAQDFYAAFGKDSYGTIGNDTTIMSADFDGINMIAIQGLIKRTSELKKENSLLKAKNELLADQQQAQTEMLGRLYDERERDMQKMAAMETRLRDELKEEKIAMHKELNRLLNELQQNKTAVAK